VRYERVTAAPEATLRQLCEFLGLEFETTMLDAARTRPDKDASRSGQVTRNTRRAEDYFGSRTIDRMEAIAGGLLAELGYNCRNRSGDVDPPAWRVRMWRIGDDWRRFTAVATRRGRIFRPSKWRYIFSRTSNALKQRKTTHT
jgi:hypothetical protein